jgi:integrase/recombinase XerC
MSDRALPESTEIVPRESAATPPLVAALVLPGAEHLMRAFLDGRRASTLDAYERDLDDFARFVQMPDARRAMGVLLAAGQGAANAVALEYKAHLGRRGLASATVKRRLSALRSAVKIAKTIGVIAWTLEIESPKVEPYRDTAGPGLTMWLQIERTARARAMLGDPIPIRDLAILHFAWILGLRRGEIVAIDLEHLDLGGEPARVWVLGKGRNDREPMTLPAEILPALRAWLAVRPAGPGPLFIRLDKASDPDRLQRLTGRSVGNLVPAAGHRAGSRRRVTPHQIRHAAITAVLDLTGDLRRAAKFSRHKDVRTLLIYDDRRKDDAGELAKLLGGLLGGGH